MRAVVLPLLLAVALLLACGGVLDWLNGRKEPLDTIIDWVTGRRDPLPRPSPEPPIWPAR